jgi:hypothetical protein
VPWEKALHILRGPSLEHKVPTWRRHSPEEWGYPLPYLTLTFPYLTFPFLSFPYRRSGLDWTGLDWTGLARKLLRKLPMANTFYWPTYFAGGAYPHRRAIQGYGAPPYINCAPVGNSIGPIGYTLLGGTIYVSRSSYILRESLPGNLCRPKGSLPMVGIHY